MTENSKASTHANFTLPVCSAPIESILCTDELKNRPLRPPDYEKESRALVALAHALSESPRTVLQALVDTILDVCRAGSAGISLLTKDDGGKHFYWPAIAGAWKGHVGGGTPRNFGPCGDVLDRDMPLLMHHVQRRYTYFEPVKPAVEEALLIPFYIQGKAVGTIWAVAHDDRKFDSEDERLMKSLGQFASSAYQALESLDALKFQAADAMKGEQAAALLAAIVDSSDDAIISKRLDGVITSWNRSAERLFGYTAEEANGKHITLIVPPDRLDEEATILQRLRRGERVDHFETVRVRKDGTYVDISVTISPVRDASGQIIGASKVARDISERKQMETDRQRFVTLADRCPEFIGMSDLEGRPFYVNDAGLKLVGLQSLDELRKVMVIDFFFPEDRDRMAKEFIPKALRDGNNETEIRFKNFSTGAAIWMIFNVFVLRNLDGELAGLATFSQNITERKHTEQALRESEERLRALADQLESQVLLRTQELEQRNLEVLQQSEQLRELSKRLVQSQDEERRRIARDLHDSAGQIVTVLGMHLAVISQDAIKPEVRKAAEESHEMLQQLSKEIRTVSYLLHPPLLDENGLPEAIRWYIKGLENRSGFKINLDIPKNFGRLPDDVEVAIFRIVQECLTNIHRHSGAKKATIRIAHNVAEVSLEIQDDGVGIAKDVLAAIRTQRSGVGMTGMRERIRHLGGNLDIQSDSSGTKISVTFPLIANLAADSGIADKARAAE
jgi:PAS domain S-box-containing protein